MSLLLVWSKDRSFKEGMNIFSQYSSAGTAMDDREVRFSELNTTYSTFSTKKGDSNEPPWGKYCYIAA
jgi:hypothetical protein